MGNYYLSHWTTSQISHVNYSVDVLSKSTVVNGVVL